MKIGILSTDRPMTQSLCKTVEAYRQRKFIDIDAVVFSSIGEYFSSGQDCDVYIINDNFDRHSSLETARLVRTKDAKTALVLIAKNPDKVYDAFKVKAHRFLVQPVTESMLFEALDAFRKDQFTARGIILKVEALYCTFHAEEVLYLEANGKQSCLHTRSKTVQATTPFSQVSLQLPGEYYYPVHRSFIVNMCHVRAFDPEHLLLDNGDSVPLSRRRKVDFFIQYSKFVSGHNFL